MDFSKAWKNSDQIIKVQSKDFHVHRCMLSLWSPVFDRMFHSSFKEKNSLVVELKIKYAGEFEEMLQVMYDRKKTITDENFNFLLELSEEYQMEQLQSQCIQYLNRADKTGLKSLRYLAHADQYRLEETVSACVCEIASVPFAELEIDHGYKNLSDKLKNLVLTLKTQQHEKRRAQTDQLVGTLTECFYQSAAEGYTKFLRDQGLESTVLNKCPFKESHVNKQTGRNFDPHCVACRKIVTVPKTVTVENGSFSFLMEELIESMKSLDDNDRGKIGVQTLVNRCKKNQKKPNCEDP